MTKPVGTNAQLATTCGLCSGRMLTATYPTMNHSGECLINQYLTGIEDEKLKIISIDSELDQLLTTKHGLPFYEFKFTTDNGFLHAVYAPNWVAEGIQMYYNMDFAGLSMGDFLLSLAP